MITKNEKTLTVESQKILLVEGKDEVNFFEAFLRYKNLDSIKLINCEGKDKLKEKLSALKKAPDFNTVTSLAIIQDANDEGPQRRFQSVCSILKNNKLPIPDKMASFALKKPTPGKPRVGIFIMPDCQHKGMLETLCLSTVESKNINKCIDDFMDCMGKNLKSKPPKNSDKAKLHAYLATMEEDTPSLGVATQKGYWDLNSDKLKPLSDFLQKL